MDHLTEGDRECSHPRSDEARSGAGCSRQAADLLYAWRDALIARDAHAFAGLFSDTGVMIDPEHRTDDLAAPLRLVGHEAIEAATRRWSATVGDFTYVIDDVLAAGDRAVALWTYEWAARSGRQSLEGVTWLCSDAGYITLAKVYFDSFAMLSAEGLAGARRK